MRKGRGSSFGMGNVSVQFFYQVVSPRGVYHPLEKDQFYLVGIGRKERLFLRRNI